MVKSGQERKEDHITDFNGVFWKASHKSYHDNVILSPLNVSILMAILRLGGRGNTYREILVTFKFPEEHQTIEDFHKIIESLKTETSGVELSINNIIFNPTYCTFRKEVLKIAETKLQAAMVPVDFTIPDSAADEINKYVRQATENRFTEILTKADVTAETHLVVASLVYFKGELKYNFLEENTTETVFYVTGGKKVTVPMMHGTFPLPYVELPNIKAQAVGLPYTGDRFVLVIVLPEKRYGLTEVEKSLDSKFCFAIHSKLIAKDNVQIDLFMPRLRAAVSHNVRSDLERLGMKSIFLETAELSACFEKPEDVPHSARRMSLVRKQEKVDKIHVSNIIQKISFEISEGQSNGDQVEDIKSIEPTPVIVAADAHPRVSLAEPEARTTQQQQQQQQPHRPSLSESPPESKNDRNRRGTVRRESLFADPWEDRRASIKADAPAVASDEPVVVPFCVDHPFLYFIVDELTGTVLFIGMHVTF